MTILPTNFNDVLIANVSGFFSGVSSFVILLIAIPFTFWVIEYLIKLVSHRVEEHTLMAGLTEEQIAEAAGIAEEQVELKQFTKLEKHFEKDLGI
jgi:hypothetical protein